MEGTIGEIRLFAGNYPPANWEFCNGMLISLNQYEAAYSIIGTTYGGDGYQTFALPDLRGRIPVGTSSQITLGQVLGNEQVALNNNTMPSHTHTMMASLDGPVQNTASGAALASNTRATNPPMNSIYAVPSDNRVTTGSQTGVTGSAQPFPVVQPVNTLNYIICLIGIYPSRS
jgi:microcystin-dependent protein